MLQLVLASAQGDDRRLEAAVQRAVLDERQQLPPDDEVWIDASTYLVVQTKNYKPSPAGTKGTWLSFTTTVNWLPATPANLANLSTTPPRGYTKIPATGMVKYLGPVS